MLVLTLTVQVLLLMLAVLCLQALLLCQNCCCCWPEVFCLGATQHDFKADVKIQANCMQLLGGLGMFADPRHNGL